MSLLKKLAGETAIYGLSSIIGRVLNYLLTPLYTAVLVPGEYGIISQLYAWVGFLMVLFILRFDTAFFRFGTDEKERERAYSTSLWTVLGTSLVFSLTIIVFSQDIAQLLEYRTDQGFYFIIFGLVLGLDTLSEIPFARLRLENRPKRFAFVRLTGIGLNIFFNLFFLLVCPFVAENMPGSTLHGLLAPWYDPGFGVGYIFLANLIASAATVLMLLPEMLKASWQFDPQLWKKMLLYSAPLILASLAGIVNEVIDRQLLIEFLPYGTAENRAQLGIYSACYKLAMLMAMFTQAFRYAAEPFFFANAKNKDAKVLYGTITRYFTIAGAIVFLFVTFNLSWLKEFLRSEAYWEGLGIVPVLLMANLLLGLYYNVSIWYKLTDQTKIGGWIAIGGAAITIFLNIWWIPSYGYLGSAWATLVCYFSMTLACWWMGRKHYPVQYGVKKIIIYIALAISLYLVNNNVIANFDIKKETLLSIGAFLIIIYSFAAIHIEKRF